jgi:hypothetical protein
LPLIAKFANLFLLYPGLNGLFVLAFDYMGTSSVKQSGFQTRMIAPLMGTAADDSLEMRMILVGEGLARIKTVWLTGHYMNEVTSGPGKGWYIHNWLSYLECYGIFPFAFFWMITVYLLFASLRITLRFNVQSATIVVCALLVFGIISILVARSYVWFYIWFFLSGAASNYDRERFRFWNRETTVLSTGGPSAVNVVE